jgi:hypothetical protein
MYVSSISRVLAVALVVTLLGFGPPALQAGQHECGCPQVLEKPATPEPAPCCPVDPKEVRKAEKEAEHARHEAAEACEKQQKAAAKAQEIVEKAQAEADKIMAEANDKLAQRNAELAEANAQLASLSSQMCPYEGVAKGNEVEVERAKPMPGYDACCRTDDSPCHK